MNNKETLDIAELVAMSRRFDDLYMLGVLGFHGGAVHLNERCFKGLFGQWEITEWDSADFPYEHSATVDDVKFFCIGDKVL